MKKILSIILAMVLTWASLLVWNFADIWASMAGISSRWFDALSLLAFFGAIIAAGLFFDNEKEVRRG